LTLPPIAGVVARILWSSVLVARQSSTWAATLQPASAGEHGTRGTYAQGTGELVTLASTAIVRTVQL